MHRSFKRAAAYAEAILKDRVAREAYETMAVTKGTSAYRLAFTNLLSKSKIRMVDTSCYDGKTHCSIRMEAEDAFSINEVGVKVYDQKSALVEDGLAVKYLLNKNGI